MQSDDLKSVSTYYVPFQSNFCVLTYYLMSHVHFLTHVPVWVTRLKNEAVLDEIFQFVCVEYNLQLHIHNKNFLETKKGHYRLSFTFITHIFDKLQRIYDIIFLIFWAYLQISLVCVLHIFILGIWTSQPNFCSLDMFLKIFCYLAMF